MHIQSPLFLVRAMAALLRRLRTSAHCLRHADIVFMSGGTEANNTGVCLCVEVQVPQCLEYPQYTCDMLPARAYF
jgi:hypothetical protein